MNNYTSFLIDVDEMVPPPDDYNGFHWAKPSMSMLRGAMRGVFTLRQAAAAVGMKGRTHVTSHFSREQVGLVLKRRLRGVLSTRPETVHTSTSHRAATLIKGAGPEGAAQTDAMLYASVGTFVLLSGAVVFCAGRCFGRWLQRRRQVHRVKKQAYRMNKF